MNTIIVILVYRAVGKILTQFELE